MSTSAARRQRKPYGAEPSRRCVTMLRSSKEAIDAAARKSGMSASSYLEFLLVSHFGGEVPRLVLTSILRDGTVKEVPLGMSVNQRQWLATDTEEIARPAYTFSPEFNEQLGSAARASRLNFSAYMRRLLEMTFQDGYPTLVPDVVFDTVPGSDQAPRTERELSMA